MNDDLVKAKNLRAWGKKAMLYGYYDEALRCLDLAMRLEPRSWETLMLLGDFAFSTQSYGESLLFFQKALILDPKNQELLFRYERALEKTGKEDFL